MAQFHAAKIVVLLSDATCLLPAEWHNKRLLELHCITVENSVCVQIKKKIKNQLCSLKLQGKQISQDLDLTMIFNFFFINYTV